MVGIYSIFILNGCATMKESVMTGIATGAVTGLVLGPLADRSDGDTKLGGALIGAAVGGIAAYFIHEGLEDRDAKIRKETLFNLDKFNVSRPPESSDNGYGIASPAVQTQCFDTEVHGSKLIQAHCESQITGNPEWVKRSNSKKKADSE